MHMNFTLRCVVVLPAVCEPARDDAVAMLHAACPRQHRNRVLLLSSKYIYLMCVSARARSCAVYWRGARVRWGNVFCLCLQLCVSHDARYEMKMRWRVCACVGGCYFALKEHARARTRRSTHIYTLTHTHTQHTNKC